MHQYRFCLGFVRFVFLFSVGLSGLCACAGSTPDDAEDAAADADLDAEAQDAGDGAQDGSPGDDAGPDADDADAGASSMDASDAEGSDARPEQDADAAGDAVAAGDADAAVDAAAAGDAAADGSAADAGCVATSTDEKCDGVDNDCDGTVDELCIPFSSYLDFDVRGDGAVVAVGLVSERLQMMCFRPDGSVLREPFEVGAPEAGHANPKFSGVDVARSHGTGNIVVTFGYWNFPSANSNDWRVYAAFYDDACQLVKSQFALDSDIARVPDNIVRNATAFMTDDGRAYLIHEHQTANRFRVLIYDAQGTRTGLVELLSPTDCSGGALTRALALDRQSGKFAVACERSGGRVYRRFEANGTPIDPGMTFVTGSTTMPFSFHYFGAALNAAGTFLYFGRVSDTESILRAYPAGAAPTPATGSAGAFSGPPDPIARVTSKGEFLIELFTETYSLALVKPDASVVRTWATSPLRFELDDSDRVYVHDGRRVRVSPTITLQ